MGIDNKTCNTTTSNINNIPNIKDAIKTYERFFDKSFFDIKFSFVITYIIIGI